MAATDLYDAMVAFFDVCYAALADTPDGQPECAYVAEGPPAWDVCPCLTVYAGGPQVADTFPLQPSLNPTHRVALWGEVDMVTLTATILRCSPVIGDDGLLPTPAAHAAAARQTSADLWAVWNHLKQAHRDETLFPPKRREFALDPAVAVNPQGGCAGWQISLRVRLDGYDPTAP